MLLFETGSCVAQAGFILAMVQRNALNPNPPVFTSQVLGFQACISKFNVHRFALKLSYINPFSKSVQKKKRTIC